MNLSDRNNITNAENALCLAIAVRLPRDGVMRLPSQILTIGFAGVRIVSAVHSDNIVLFAANTWSVFSTREIPFHTISPLIFFGGLSEPEIEPAIIDTPLSRVKNRPISRQTRARKSS